MRRFLAGVFLMLWPLSAHAEDATGCADNQMTGRYEGASIAWCKAKDFDELQFLRAPHDYGALLDRNATKDHSGPEWLKKQGKAQEIRYELQDNTSALEAATNYESLLKSKGFKIVFSCADQECLTGNLRDLYLLGEQLDPGNGVSTAYADHARYLLAAREGVTASVLVGEDKEKSTAFLRVLEEQAIQNKISEALADKGSVNVYGILFDFDKDVVKPESAPTLSDIAKALTANPQLKLKIIGHTDSKGGESYNLELSQRRAANVLAALTGDYGIEPSRLSSDGAGMSHPIESNDTDEGRAKNRRVELVSE